MFPRLCRELPCQVPQHASLNICGLFFFLFFLPDLIAKQFVFCTIWTGLRLFLMQMCSNGLFSLQMFCRFTFVLTLTVAPCWPGFPAERADLAHLLAATWTRPRAAEATGELRGAGKATCWGGRHSENLNTSAPSAGSRGKVKHE